MTFDKYQKEAMSTASYPDKFNNMVYPALGLVGEAGEVAEKVKKLWRNYGLVSARVYPPERKAELTKELGDVLWYIAAMATEMEIQLSDIAAINLSKLASRRERDVIKGEGDNR